MTVARSVSEPGWRWSTDTQPLVGGEWCEARHIGVVISGRWGSTPAGRHGSRVRSAGRLRRSTRPRRVHDWERTGGDHRVVRHACLGRTESEFHDRVLATLLFTDLVGSTTTAVQIGDVSWRELLAIHHRAADSEVERFRGRIVDTAGDGLLAIFRRTSTGTSLCKRHPCCSGQAGASSTSRRPHGRGGDRR